MIILLGYTRRAPTQSNWESFLCHTSWHHLLRNFFKMISVNLFSSTVDKGRKACHTIFRKRTQMPQQVYMHLYILCINIHCAYILCIYAYIVHIWGIESLTRFWLDDRLGNQIGPPAQSFLYWDIFYLYFCLYFFVFEKIFGKNVSMCVTYI